MISKLEEPKRNTIIFKRYCKDCGELYRPNGKHENLCQKCRWLPKHKGGGRTPKK